MAFSLRCLTFLSSCLLASASEVQIFGELGKTVTLPCKVPSSIKNILAVEWTRPELEPQYVILYRDGHLEPEYQYQLFKDRVELRDKLMKNGDVSLNIKNMTNDDPGTYECHVHRRGYRKRSSYDTKPIKTIKLIINQGDAAKDGGDSRGHGLIAAVSGLMCTVLIGVWIFKQSKRHMKKSSSPPPPDEVAVNQLS